MRKLAAHGDGIALVHSRTDTAWWREATAGATALCFIAGRVRFIRGATMSQEGAGSPAPCALIAYGIICATAVAASGLGPTLIIPHEPRRATTTDAFAEAA